MEGSPVQQLSPTEEQEKWLHEAFKAVKQHAFYMKRALVGFCRPLPRVRASRRTGAPRRAAAAACVVCARAWRDCA